jgi:hypothetical protein
VATSDRTVRHLRLRAPNAQAATHAAHQLEDALRCASLPDTGERVLLVRRLQLGRLPVGLSSQSLSLLIEQRVAAVGGEWVHGGEARAAHRNTVFFANRLQAAQAALQRRATGLPLDGWHWSLALPGVRVDAPPAVFLAQLVDALALQPAAPLVLREWVADAVRAGAAAWLVRHMDASMARRVVVWTGAHAEPVSVAVVAMRDPQGPVHALPIAAATTAWLTAVLRTARWHAVPGRAQGAPLAGAPASEAGALPHAEAAVADGPHKAPRRGARARHAAATVPAADAGAAPAAPAMPAASDPLRVAPAAPLGFADGIATGAGGLVFLLPVLDRLGFACWQAEQPEAPLAAAVLHAALQRLRVPEDDPAWALVASLPQPPSHAARTWTAPTGWRDARIGVAHDGHAIAPDAMAARWLAAARRYLRRVARIGLASLCLRGARVQWSRTHLDLRFAPGEADVRVRRMGLDLDPGWLPWLERVVSIHYRQGDAR